MISAKAINTLKLKCVRGITDQAISKIYAACGSLDGAFALDFGSLTGLGIKKETAENIITADIDEKLLEREFASADKKQADIICIDDAEYPPLLRETESAPALLFVRGKREALLKPSIAVVGSRNATRQACDFAKKLSQDLAEVGFNVVSGFAHGIDVYAHAGAINKGLTTAVMGCGINHFYPEANKRYEPTVLKSGCIVTEFFSDMPALAGNFPQRNRIISGMSHGVVVVEASARSGSLITARYAGEQGREVYAVPAFPMSKNCATNKLIKDGARLTESYYDILDELRYRIDGLKEVDKPEPVRLQFGNPDDARLYSLLENGMLNPDELSTLSGMDIGSVTISLVQMELEGYVIREIDGKYRAAGGNYGQNSHSS